MGWLSVGAGPAALLLSFVVVEPSGLDHEREVGVEGARALVAQLALASRVLLRAAPADLRLDGRHVFVHPRAIDRGEHLDQPREMYLDGAHASPAEPTRAVVRLIQADGADSAPDRIPVGLVGLFLHTVGHVDLGSTPINKEGRCLPDCKAGAGARGHAEGRQAPSERNNRGELPHAPQEIRRGEGAASASVDSRVGKAWHADCSSR